MAGFWASSSDSTLQLEAQVELGAQDQQIPVPIPLVTYWRGYEPKQCWVAEIPFSISHHNKITSLWGPRHQNMITRHLKMAPGRWEGVVVPADHPPALRSRLQSLSSKHHIHSPRLAKIQEEPTNLHHEDNGIECNHDHDKILKGRGHHKFPHLVLKRLLVLRHVAGQWLGTYGEVYAGPLQNKKGMKRKQKRADSLHQSRYQTGRVSRAFSGRWYF